MSPCEKCFQQRVVNFCLNTWQRNVEIVTFLKWCLSVFTNTTCVLLGGLTKKYSEAIHCLIVDTYTAGSEEHFCKEKVWLTPSSNKVFMVSSMPSLGRTTCLTHRCRPHRPYFLLCTVFRVLLVDASQYNLFCMHMKYLYPKYTQKHCSNIRVWIDGLSFSPGWLNV